MKVKMTKPQAVAQFRAGYAKPGDCAEVAKSRFIAAKNSDSIAMHVAWGMFTDGLQKSGEITEWQYENWGYPF
jgi:hypothetical protein